MQIRIDPENEQPLRESAKRNRRSVAKEGNVAMGDYLAPFRVVLKPKPKSKKS